jgi:hypothetical protein
MRFLAVVAIIIVAIILYILLFVKRKDPHKEDPFYNYDDIKKNLKTGDIILFSCNQSDVSRNIVYYLRTELVGSPYGHCGLIYRDNDGIWVLECVMEGHSGDEYATHLNDRRMGGVRFIELDILLKEYYKDNKSYFAIMFAADEIPNSHVMDNIEYYRDKTFESKIKLFFLGGADVCVSNRFCRGLHSLMEDEDKIMCSCFVHNILYRCGALKEYPSKLFWPHLLNREDFRDLQNVKYSRPYKFAITDEYAHKPYKNVRRFSLASVPDDKINENNDDGQGKDKK